MHVLTCVAIAAVAASLGLYGTMMSLLVFALLVKRRRRATPAPDVAPRVTIFKPLAGADDDLGDNLASFAAIDYPSFEILFGVASPSDPAMRCARAFLAGHPKIDARVLVTNPEDVRAYVVLVCWVRACLSRRIEWRGHPFLLKRGSVIVPIQAERDTVDSVVRA